MVEEANQVNLYSFLYQRRRYYGQIRSEALAFNTNLQEFAQRVSYI